MVQLRRLFFILAVFVGLGTLLWPQVSSRGVKALPRGKPSGIPFHAKFTDVAAQSGLTESVVYGGVRNITYLTETSGGGVAFFDFDNDGWQDIFIVNGARADEPALQPSHMLYRNQRDGTFARAQLKSSCWGMAVATYPFFGKVAELVGRLSAIQGDCASAEVHRRMSETYGEREGTRRMTEVAPENWSS